MQNSPKVGNFGRKGKKVYENGERLSYMEQTVDLSQPDYKRFRLGKYANNVVGRLGRRNNSLEPIPGGTFMPLKHPYEWNTGKKKKDPYSLIKPPKSTSKKVTDSSFDAAYYKDSLKQHNPYNQAKDIASRMKCFDSNSLNTGSYLNTRCLKNISTISDLPKINFNSTTKLRSPDTKSMLSFYKNGGLKRDISPKVGYDSSVSISSQLVFKLITSLIAFLC